MATSRRSRHRLPLAVREFQKLKKAVYKRDKGICQICFCDTRTAPAKKGGRHRHEIHHIVPKCDGGQDTWRNLQTLCIACHKRETNELLARKAHDRRFLPARTIRPTNTTPTKDGKTISAGLTAKGTRATMATFEELAKGGGDFKPCPEGRHSARLVDVVDEGWLETTYQGQHTGYAPHLKFIWETAPFEYEDGNDDEDLAELNGKTFLLFDRRMKLSTHENAHLRKTLDSWLTPKGVIEMFGGGKDVIDVIESLVGRAACVQVQHNKSADGKKTYANIATVLPHGRRDAPLPETTEYVRRCLRDDWSTKAPQISYRVEPDEALTILEGQPPAPRAVAPNPSQPLPPTNRPPVAVAAAPVVPNPAPTAPSAPPVDVSQMVGNGQAQAAAQHKATVKAMASGNAATPLLNAVQMKAAARAVKSDAAKYDVDLPPVPADSAGFAAWETAAREAIDDAAGSVFDQEEAAPVLAGMPAVEMANTAHV